MGAADDLVRFAREHPSDTDRSGDYPARKAALLRKVLGPDADVEMVGPFTPPGAPNGIVLRGEAVVAEWGDTAFVAEIASATKSFLSTLAGIAVRDGRIRDLDASVHDDTRLDPFASAHARRITWRHLLHQSSEWDGTLFGKSPAGHAGRRAPQKPAGARFEYNDVRVNLLARALLEVFEEPLPDVLRREVMAPIGASSTWSWHGYSTSRVEVGGRLVESVSGGAHWGGGIWMSTHDLARYASLYLHDGVRDGTAILPRGWVHETWTSSPHNYMYGYLWWLQHDREGRFVSATAHGGGTHLAMVVPAHETVAVVRWLHDDHWIEFANRVLALPEDRPALGPIDVDFSRVNA